LARTPSKALADSGGLSQHPGIRRRVAIYFLPLNVRRSTAVVDAFDARRSSRDQTQRRAHLRARLRDGDATQCPLSNR